MAGESALPHVVEEIRRMAGEHDELEHVNEVLTLHMGPEYILMELGAKAKHVWIIGDWNLVILIPADRW